MDRDQHRSDVAEAIQRAEIKAVALVLRSGTRLRLGQSVDYAIEGASLTSSKRTKPYRVAVEQWHLDAANRMLREPLS